MVHKPAPMKLGSAMGREREPPGVSPVAPSSSYCSKFCLELWVGGRVQHRVVGSWVRVALAPLHPTQIRQPIELCVCVLAASSSWLGPLRPFWGESVNPSYTLSRRRSCRPPARPPACPARAPPPAGTAAAAQTACASPAPQRRGGRAAPTRRHGCEGTRGGRSRGRAGGRLKCMSRPITSWVTQSC